MVSAYRIIDPFPSAQTFVGHTENRLAKGVGIDGANTAVPARMEAGLPQSEQKHAATAKPRGVTKPAKPVATMPLGTSAESGLCMRDIRRI